MPLTYLAMTLLMENKNKYFGGERDMTSGIQKICKKLGESGCYLLCLIEGCARITKMEYNPILAYQCFLERGWIDDDCFVKSPESIIKFYLNKNVFVIKSNETMKYAIITIAKYYNKRTGLSHFVLCTDKGIWDPLGNSKTEL